MVRLLSVLTVSCIPGSDLVSKQTAVVKNKIQTQAEATSYLTLLSVTNFGLSLSILIVLKMIFTSLVCLNITKSVLHVLTYKT